MKRFSRAYTWGSLAGVLLAALGLSLLVRHVTEANLIATGERDTVALTHAFANALGPEWLDWVDESATLPLDALKAHPRIASLQSIARQQLRNTDVAKIKIYALNGRTVFSTEAAQIGESKTTNAGFLLARAGGTPTELTHRAKFSAFDQVVENRNLLSAYVPLRDPGSGRVRVVFELYSDVTPLVREIDRSQAALNGVVFSVLLALYALQLLLVRACERKPLREHEELRTTARSLEHERDDLTRRMQERTQQLEQCKAALEVANLNAQRANQRRTDTLVRASSELRTPIDTVVSAGRALAATTLDAQQKIHVERLHGAADHLRALLIERFEDADASPDARVREAQPA